MCTYFVAVAFRRLHRTGVENDLKEAGNRTEVSQNTFQGASSPCWREALEAWLRESLVHFGKRLQINEIGSSRTQDRANIMGVRIGFLTVPGSLEEDTALKRKTGPQGQRLAPKELPSTCVKHDCNLHTNSFTH